VGHTADTRPQDNAFGGEVPQIEANAKGGCFVGEVILLRRDFGQELPCPGPGLRVNPGVR
jgi:hypothetical protein